LLFYSCEFDVLWLEILQLTETDTELVEGGVGGGGLARELPTTSNSKNPVKTITEQALII
jgi:hypothetical protein